MRFLLRQQSHAAEELGRVASSSVTVGSTCYADIAGALLAAGDTSNALRWAWRAVRESPLSARAWMTAVTSLRGTVANAMEKGATSEHIAKLLDRWETTLSLAPSWRRDRDGALFNDCPELVSILQLLDLERRYIVATMATDDAQSARLTAILHYVDQFIAADNAQSSSSSLLLPSAYQLLAACLSRLAYHAQAVSALQNAITLSPERFDLWVALAIAYRRSRNTVAAVECLQCATTLPGISRDRCTKVALFIAQAVFALASSRNVALASSRDCLAIASDAVNAALQLDPTSRNARMLQAIVNLRQGNKSKAVKLLRADTGADHDGDEDVIYGHKEWLARAEAA